MWCIAAEEGCLQYFTGVSGTIKSFNYDPNGGLQLSNQDYSICVRMERNFCGIQYNQCADTGKQSNQRKIK
ncbi:Cubilin [Frankliniella fusca]|uniref:Cubilin n=1 Tax=Frankliniella fusca TaxID=407009 RepID=A0AAE1LM09_9NEOP|nr:Cubilin [Frankliniella fusca]